MKNLDIYAALVCYAGITGLFVFRAWLDDCKFNSRRKGKS